MAKIKLTNSKKLVIIDFEDLDKVKYQDWHLNGYDQFTVRNRADIAIANVIMNDFVNMYDHKNRNALDNRKENLRIANQSQNNINREKYDFMSTSQYKGVHWREDNRSWRAKIQINRIKINLGHFKNEEDAARAYDKAALENFGEFAVLNFPKSE